MANQIPSDPANEKIAGLTQEQLNVSRGQFTKINAQNEALGAVILELAASQAQQDDIEARQIKREKFYRRRDFIVNQIVARFQRVAAKKAAIQSENQFNRDLIEQKAQADAGLSIAKNTNMLTSLTGFMQRDIAQIAHFMMGNKLAEEEKRREMLAALKDNDGVGRREFQEKKYSGFLKTLGKVLLGVPFFLVGFFQGYFQQLGKVLKGFANVSKWIDNKVFKGFFQGLGKSIKVAFSGINTRISSLFSKITNNKAVAKGIDFIKNIATRVGGIFTSIQNNKAVAKGIDFIKNIATRVGGFFTSIQNKLVNGKGFQKFLAFASKAKALGNIFGKLFLPLKIILGVFSFVKGFMKGKEEGGFIEGIKQGFLSLFDTLVGSVLMLAANILSFVLKFLGFENAAESIKESFSMVIDGIKGVFSGLVDLVKGIFTLDGALIMESLGKIWDGVKNILMAGPNAFMGLIKDIFGADEEGEGGLVNKIKSVYERIKEFLAAPLEKIKGFLDKLNPFSKSNEEIQAEIEKEKGRVYRSQLGENEYLGGEEKGRGNRGRTRAKLAQNGAEMAAIEKENADMKAQSSGGSPTIINNNYQVDNSQTNTATMFHQGNMMDEGLVAVGG
jgi:hypothetical protein